MQKTVLIALAVVGTLTAGYFLMRKPSQAQPTDALKDIYNQWKAEYKINVGAGEDDFRFKVFSGNFEKINQHNRLLGRSFSMGLNSFAHLTQEEFSATRLGLRMPKTVEAKNFTELSSANLKSTVDWTSKMNAVRDQGQCGSCWAFSAVGAHEGLHSVVKGNLFSVSEQELVDCSSSYGNMGCNGGLMDYAFQYIQKVGGLADRASYPYTATDGKCKTVTKRTGPITGFQDVKVNSAAALKAALNVQPVAVAIEADTSIFQLYKSGVITSASCGTSLDHGVVAVGYNADDKTPYYRVRNSWGASWGDKGHVNIGIKDGQGICGIQMAASYPTA